MNYLVQIDGTSPKNWRRIPATNREVAIIKAIKPIIEEGHSPQTAYVALGESRHSNGAPICVQSFSLHINRDKKETQ